LTWNSACLLSTMSLDGLPFMNSGLSPARAAGSRQRIEDGRLLDVRSAASGLETRAFG
jgi:hypothetical protein